MVRTCIRTLRLKVRPESYSWLDAAAIEVNQVWNYSNEVREAAGIDLGLKNTATTSDGEKLQAGNFYRRIELKIAQAQRRGHKRQAKRLHRRAARRRKEALHRFSRRIVDAFQTIVIGDVSSLKLAKTRMAKPVLDAGWWDTQNATAVQGPAGR